MTNEQIKTVGQTIAQETTIGGNTAARVGGVVEGIGAALDNKDAAVGYFLGTISGGSIYVNAPNYLLGSGGNLKIKMPAAATSACTLTIGNAQAVQLWYNGAAVSSSNTWDAGEIVSVYYDGTRFMASNSQGGAKFSGGQKVSDITLEQTLGSGVNSVVSQKGISDAVFNEIDINDIDDLKNLADALNPSSSLKPTYYTVTAVRGSVVMKVGSMAVISDNLGHVVTEIMSTHYLLDTDGYLTDEHDDAEVFTIFRSVKGNGGTLPTPVGTWTAWKYINQSVWPDVASVEQRLLAMMGYYVCDTAEGTAAKTISASGYTLTNGGCIRIKMTNANTADNATLNINSTGAKALFYDGAQASSANTWEAGEVLEVYYDGTQYQCASGGGGKFATGERVKETGITDAVEDNTELLQSKAVYPLKQSVDLHTLMLENCYHEGVTEEKTITNAQLGNTYQNFSQASTRIALQRAYLISVTDMQAVKLTVQTSAVSADPNIDRCQITMYNVSKSYMSSLDPGWFYFNQGAVEITIDLTNPVYRSVAYVGVYFGSNNVNISPSSINVSGITFLITLPSHTKAVDEEMLETIITPLTETAEEHAQILSNCYRRGEGSTTSMGISSSDLANTNVSHRADSKRATLIKDSLISVTNIRRVKVTIPYSAVSSDPNIDRVTLPMYTGNKNFINAHDIGWVYFNGETVVIDIILTEEYGDVYYIGLTFGSNTNISLSSINTTGIVFELTDTIIYLTKAVDTELLAEVKQMSFDTLPTTEKYMGDRISLGLPYCKDMYSYTYEQIGTLPSTSLGRQGGAVYGDYLLQIYTNVEAIAFFNLATNTNVQMLNLTALRNFHGNSAGFSNTFYDANDPFPLLYISGMEQRKINVYRITGTAGNFDITLVQTITMGVPYYLTNIAVDAGNNRIIGYGYTKNSVYDAVDNYCIYYTFDIPDYSSGDITVSTFNYRFRLPFVTAHQGAFAMNNKLYVSWGIANMNDGILVVDYINGLVTNVIGLNFLGNTEPEALCEYKGDMILTAQNSKIFKLKF